MIAVIVIVVGFAAFVVSGLLTLLARLSACMRSTEEATRQIQAVIRHWDAGRA